MEAHVDRKTGGLKQLSKFTFYSSMIRCLHNFSIMSQLRHQVGSNQSLLVQETYRKKQTHRQKKVFDEVCRRHEFTRAYLSNYFNALFQNIFYHFPALFDAQILIQPGKNFQKKFINGHLKNMEMDLDIIMVQLDRIIQKYTPKENSKPLKCPLNSILKQISFPKTS